MHVNGHNALDRSEVLTVAQVADYLQMSDLTVYRLIQNKVLPAFKIGGSWRIKMSDLQAFIEQQKVQRDTKAD